MNIEVDGGGQEGGMGVRGLVRFLEGCAITIPWMVAAFLCGLALGMWRAELRTVQQYEARLGEAQFREDIANQAMGLLIDNKFRVNWAKADAIKRSKAEQTK